MEQRKGVGVERPTSPKHLNSMGVIGDNMEEQKEIIEDLCDQECAVEFPEEIEALNSESTTSIIDAVIDRRMEKLNGVRAMVDAGTVTDLVFKVSDKESMYELLDELESEILMGLSEVEYMANSRVYAGRQTIENGVIIVKRAV